MSKILFISYNSLENINNGGKQIGARNYRILNMHNNVEFFIIENRNKVMKLVSIFQGYYPTLLDKDVLKVISMIKINKYDFIYLDNSLLGNIAQRIKNKTNSKVITYFHNVELDYVKACFRGRFISYPILLVAKQNEWKALKYSDFSICLNEKDKKRLEKVYNLVPNSMIPATFSDKCLNINLKERIVDLNPGYCLFVGAISASNYDAAEWFSRNVSPFIKMKTIILGSGFDKVADSLRNTNVEIYGFVENLDNFYLNAKCIISPLRYGAGMKIKIVEALMYGKFIFGTDESFAGYDFDINEVGRLCNTKEEFIYAINKFDDERIYYNQYSRNKFLSSYSDKIAEREFERLLEASNKQIQV